MRTDRKWLVITALIAICVIIGAAIAQAFVPPDDLVLTDPGTWFGSTAALAGVVFALTAFIKARFDTHEGVTIAISFASGVIIAVLAALNVPWLGGLFDGTVPEALIFGGSAALLASGGWDGVGGLLKSIMGKR